MATRKAFDLFRAKGRENLAERWANSRLGYPQFPGNWAWLALSDSLMPIVCWFLVLL